MYETAIQFGIKCLLQEYCGSNQVSIMLKIPDCPLKHRRKEENNGRGIGEKCQTAVLGSVLCSCSPATQLQPRLGGPNQEIAPCLMVSTACPERFRIHAWLYLEFTLNLEKAILTAYSGPGRNTNLQIRESANAKFRDPAKAHPQIPESAEPRIRESVT